MIMSFLLLSQCVEVLPIMRHRLKRPLECELIGTSSAAEQLKQSLSHEVQIN